MSGGGERALKGHRCVPDWRSCKMLCWNNACWRKHRLFWMEKITFVQNPSRERQFCWQDCGRGFSELEPGREGPWPWEEGSSRESQGQVVGTPLPTEPLSGSLDLVIWKQNEKCDVTRLGWGCGQSWIEGVVVSSVYALCHAVLPSFVHLTGVHWLLTMGHTWSRHMGHSCK